jgi:type II secretory pathway pseudopilin PulG
MLDRGAMVRPVSSRARIRRFALVELAIAFALFGSLLAIAVPTFVREVHASRLVEPVEGLERLGASAVAYAREHTAAPADGAQAARAFPPSAPMTPSVPPRGRCEVDPQGAWDGPTWSALAFQPVPSGSPHCFAFAFDSTSSPAKATFRAHAHGDLDGDGIPSTFEVTGRYVEGDPRGPMLDPGMFVDSEME